MGESQFKDWKTFIISATSAEERLKKARQLGLHISDGENKGKRPNNDNGGSPSNNRDSKGKQAMVTDTVQKPEPKPADKQWPQITYSFEDGHVKPILDMLIQGDRIQLPPPRREPRSAEMENPKFCHYHRFVHHATHDCYQLKRYIQNLIDSNALAIDFEEVTVAANMVSI